MRIWIKGAFICSAFALISCGANQQSASEDQNETAPLVEQKVEDTPVVLASNKPEGMNKMVLIKTEYGMMKVRLYDETPLHRDNFLKLVKEGFFNDLIFHRVIKNFMIQGGDPNSRNAAPGTQLGNGGPGYTIPAEIVPGLFHKKGVLAAARLGDQMNPKRESSGSQFYLVQGAIVPENTLQQFAARSGTTYTPAQIEAYTTIGGTPHLDGQYTVFGEVVEGLEVIDKIAAVQTQPGDRPVKDIQMTITVVQ
jgi:cyclophilin family peptidyl-prolyl cis-trans isomerase